MGEEGRAWFVALGAASLAGLAALAAGLDARAALAVAAVLLYARFALLLRRGRFGVDLLMAVVATVTLAYGMLFEGLIVMLLYALAETVEGVVEALARRRVEAAARLIPPRVLVKRGGGLVEAPVESLRIGDVVLVRVGEAVPADSVALGEASLDFSLVTGEPEPVRVYPGERVPSGAVVLEGPLRARVVAEPGESYAQRLVREALEALEEKPRLQRILERYTPHVTLGVLAAWLGLHLSLGPERGLVALLVGCPSAYIIASGYSTSLAIAGLARRGALVRGGAVLEALWSLDVVVLDKTGTLTVLRADPGMVEVRGDDPERVLAAVASAASASRHPVARALAELAPRASAGLASAAREVVGRGIVAGGLVIEPGPARPCGKTVLARVDGAEAVVCLREELAPGARELVEYVWRRGARVIIASGDRRENVERVARLLGVEEYYYGMRPEDKARLVRRLQARGRRVVFAGDGVNDAVALAAADVGIAVGGVDLARSVADAVAPHGPWQVLAVLEAGERHRRMIAAGFAAAALVKASAAAGGLAGALSLPLVALLGDDGSTLAGVAAATLAGANTILSRRKTRPPKGLAEGGGRGAADSGRAPGQQREDNPLVQEDGGPLRRGRRE